MKYSSKVPKKLCLKVQSVRMLNHLNIFRYSLKELFVILKKKKKTSKHTAIYEEHLSHCSQDVGGNMTASTNPLLSLIFFIAVVILT